MATQFPELIQVPIVDPVETAINESIDRLIVHLEQRRAQLLRELKDTREEMGANRVARQQMEQQITETRRMLERLMTHKELQSMRDRIVADLEAKQEQLQANAPPPQEVRFLCNTRNLEEHVARLGEIVRLYIPPILLSQKYQNTLHSKNPLLLLGSKDQLLEIYQHHTLSQLNLNPETFMWQICKTIESKYSPKQETI